MVEAATLLFLFLPGLFILYLGYQFRVNYLKAQQKKQEESDAKEAPDLEKST